MYSRNLDYVTKLVVYDFLLTLRSFLFVDGAQTDINVDSEACPLCDIKRFATIRHQLWRRMPA